MSAEPRYEESDKGTACLDCGSYIADRTAHTRFHSILSGHAWSLAILKTGHVSAAQHDQYRIPERIDSKKFDSWSADAFAEVVKGLDNADGK